MFLLCGQKEYNLCLHLCICTLLVLLKIGAFRARKRELIYVYVRFGLGTCNNVVGGALE